MPFLRANLLAIALAFVCGFGCSSCPTWQEPSIPRVSLYTAAANSVYLASSPCDSAGYRAAIDKQMARYAATGDPEIAQDLSETFVALAVEADQARHSSTAGWYYLATVYSWKTLSDGATSPALWNRASIVYHKGLARLVTIAQHNGAYQPGQAMEVMTPYGPVHIQLVAHEFAWQPSDFQELFPVGEYDTSVVTRKHRRSGYGLPLVVRRCHPTCAYIEEASLPNGICFAATAVLTPNENECSGLPTGIPTSATLSLYNPLNTATIEVQGESLPLASDITAPFAFSAISQGDSDFWLTSFLDPNDRADDGLFLLEPHQPEKIPVVFIHGLLSSPATWVDMANDLRAHPGFNEHYQIWAFRYSTGGPFLEAATLLRQQMTQLIALVDPQGTDPAMGDIVLLGHSMGGLVARLQTFDSGCQLWNAVANRPLDEIVTSEQIRARLAEQFFFQAQPSVRRVVYLATPHLGSEWADRPLGKLGSALVRPQAATVQRHRQLIRDNPGVFSAELQRGIPTSIDMLEPQSPLLRTIRCQPTACWITLNSIIGTKHIPLFERPGDGIVPVPSALFPGVESELFVYAKHTEVHRNPNSTEEVWRILVQHLTESQCYTADEGLSIERPLANRTGR